MLRWNEKLRRLAGFELFDSFNRKMTVTIRDEKITVMLAPWEMSAFDVEGYPCSRKRLFVITKAGPPRSQERLERIGDGDFED